MIFAVFLDPLRNGIQISYKALDFFVVLMYFLYMDNNARQVKVIIPDRIYKNYRKYLIDIDSTMQADIEAHMIKSSLAEGTTDLDGELLKIRKEV